MRKFNIVTKKTYTANGVEKAQWNNVGALVHFEPSGTKDESFILELAMFPDTKFFVFPQKEQQRSAKNEAKEDVPTVQYNEEEINSQDIPF